MTRKQLWDLILCLEKVIPDCRNGPSPEIRALYNAFWMSLSK